MVTFIYRSADACQREREAFVISYLTGLSSFDQTQSAF